MHGICTIVGDHIEALELASAAQLRSGESNGAVLQSKDGNGGDSGVEHAHCQ